MLGKFIGARSQISFNDMLIALNLFSGSTRDHFTEIHHRDLFANTHHNAHLMFDQQNRQVETWSRMKWISSIKVVASLGSCQRRLIQEKQLRVRCQRTGAFPDGVARHKADCARFQPGGPEVENAQEILGFSVNSFSFWLNL